MKNKWYIWLGVILSVTSILIVSPIYVDGIKDGINQSKTTNVEKEKTIETKTNTKDEEKIVETEEKETESNIDNKEKESNSSSKKETLIDNSKTSEEKETEIEKEVTIDETITNDKQLDFKIKNGELIDYTINEYDNIIVIKVKLDDSEFDTVSIPENLNNVVDLIKNQGLDQYKEIQYWSVIDLKQNKKTTEEKVISFTIKQENYNAIKNNNLKYYEMKEFMEDLWLHPNLR